MKLSSQICWWVALLFTLLLPHTYVGDLQGVVEVRRWGRATADSPRARLHGHMGRGEVCPLSMRPGWSLMRRWPSFFRQRLKGWLVRPISLITASENNKSDIRPLLYSRLSVEQNMRQKERNKTGKTSVENKRKIITHKSAAPITQQDLQESSMPRGCLPNTSAPYEPPTPPPRCPT